MCTLQLSAINYAYIPSDIRTQLISTVRLVVGSYSDAGECAISGITCGDTREITSRAPVVRLNVLAHGIRRSERYDTRRRVF